MPARGRVTALGYIRDIHAARGNRVRQSAADTRRPPDLEHIRPVGDCWRERHELSDCASRDFVRYGSQWPETLVRACVKALTRALVVAAWA